jgi:ferredoxin-NADP reductase
MSILAYVYKLNKITFSYASRTPKRLAYTNLAEAICLQHSLVADRLSSSGENEDSIQ